VNSVLFTPFAIFLKFHSIRCIFFIFLGTVISSLTFRAFKNSYLPQIIHQSLFLLIESAG